MGDQTRADDEDRREAVDLVGSAYVDGQLTREEFDERVEQALGAIWLSDLDAVVDDVKLAGPVPWRTEAAVVEEESQPSLRLIALGATLGTAAIVGVIATAIALSGEEVTTTTTTTTISTTTHSTDISSSSTTSTTSADGSTSGSEASSSHSSGATSSSSSSTSTEVR